MTIAGIETFYREAGPPDAPVLLLPHGYPCSSYEFRNLMPRLADRWRLIAPDFPGAGNSGTPDDFDYSFDGYAAWLEAFVGALDVGRFALYLHDFGSPIGTRLAIRDPRRITALIIQNGDIPYEDALGPKYADIEATWSLPPTEMRKALAEAISEETFKEEFLNHLPPPLGETIPPDLWKLHWSLVTPRRKEIAIELIAGLKKNRAWFPEHRKYLRENRPPTLIVWGPNDHYMPEKSARAYFRDLPEAELHLLDGGHWLLETHLDAVAALMRDFLGRVHAV
ncbi:alpha/beta fold hydrolase [Rhizobium binae]|nr:alpha/beta hydrolase [Rhizobium binae]MBX4995124.1 alpha/beta hydrolase [Rhizobium binae]NKL48861.1 alpha/beta fold hydrolase [Rhizobium leguminosarum bv. viciae]QSY85867.1 alpha/beta hydrolase [Rhizobium binae]